MSTASRRTSWVSVVLFFLVFACSQTLWSQKTAEKTPPPPAPGQNSAVEPEHHITSEEAAQLFRELDDIVKGDSKSTGLPLKHNIKHKLTSRNEVEKFLMERFEDDDSAQRLKRAEIVLKKFGLIPREFKLESFMLELLKEQVAGYYNTKDKTVYLLDWIDPEAQKPVMAHELTHALQDQNFDIEKYMGKDPKPSDKPEMQISADEAQLARQAVVEGQAMVGMLDYMLAPVGKTVENSPALVEMMQANMMEGMNSPVFIRAPLYLKQVLIFPYSFGLDFVRTVLMKNGREAAFAGSFMNPPKNSRQVMEPETYLTKEEIPAIEVPDLDKMLSPTWERYDVGGLGQFDLWILAQQYGLTDKEARSLASNWRGAYYFSVKKKTAPQNAGTDSIAVVMASRWANPEAATRFAKVFSGSIPAHFKVKTGPKGSLESPGPTTSETWQTNEGPVIVERNKDWVIVTETLDQETSDKVRQAVLPLTSVAQSIALRPELQSAR